MVAPHVDPKHGQPPSPADYMLGPRLEAPTPEQTEAQLDTLFGVRTQPQD